MFSRFRAPARRASTAVLLLLLIQGLTSCTMVKKAREAKAQKAAETAASDFRVAMDSEDYQGIYNKASDALRGSTSEERYAQYLKTVHDKTGNSRDSRQTMAEIHEASNGTMVRLKYNTDFDTGDGNEFFDFIVKDGQAKLAGYYFDNNFQQLRSH